MATFEYKPLPNEENLIGKLKDRWSIAEQFYNRAYRKMQLLDATDKGDLWKALQAKFPAYQIMPDTNWVSYTKDNLLASLYTVTKNADVIPTNKGDRELCVLLSIVLEHIWDVHQVGWYQYLAGERAALLNLGITYLTWDSKLDDIVLKNIDPMKFRRDPYAASLEEAGWCVTYDNYHKSVFQSNPNYKQRFGEFLAKNNTADEVVPAYMDKVPVDSTQPKEHYNLFIWFTREDDKIKEYHLLDNKYLLYYNEDVQPKILPFFELYCNVPGSSIIGNSQCSKIFANNMAYNLMNSITFTAEYKNQRPPKFVSSQSGLNIKAFAKHGDEADRTFIVNGDATKAVHFQQFPFSSPALPNLVKNLSYDIQNVTGVDGRYTGRDTGSIITTGGTEEMLNRVTMIDTPKIMNYEKYTRDLTKGVLEYLIHFSPARTYFVKDGAGMSGESKWKAVEVPFPTIKTETKEKNIVREYAIQISSMLPKNRQRLEAWANMIMEKQMQYRDQGQNVELMTMEEWIEHQDTPYKERMLERMGIQSQLDSLEQASQIINEYGNMIAAGMNPNEAMVMAAQGLDARKQGAATPFEEQQMQQQTPSAGLGPTSPMGGGMPSF